MPNNPKTFQEVLSAAIDDLISSGFDSMERIDRWSRLLREAAARTLASPLSLEQQLRNGLATVYSRMVDRGGIFRYNPGVERFTLEMVKPALRSELDRRILASANLIKLNRDEAIEKTLRRFQGWSTSVPVGGISAEKKSEVKKTVQKSLRSLPFEERRVLIDQGHKLTAALSEILASDGGAIAGRWRSNFRQPGYDYRVDHKDRDDKVFLVRDSWAHKAGLVRKGKAGYVDESTTPGQEPFCFPGDSRIPFADGVEKAYRRWFSGDLTTLVTASGKTLRATPNHPILTSKGWVAIGALNEGDDVIEVRDQSGYVLKNHKDQAIPLISEIFGSLDKLGGRHSTRQGQLQQFHGDGAEGDIDIVDAAWPLRFDFMTKGLHRGDEGGQEFLFPVPGDLASRIRAVGLFLQGCLRAFAGGMGGAGELAPALFAFARHANPVCFGASPEFDSKILRQGSASDFQSSGEAQEAFPFEVRSTRIVSVERRQWAGHVYNLQTASGWYVADGIIAHNCRCYYVYIFNLRDLPDEMLTKKGQEALTSASTAARALARPDSAMWRR